MASDAAQTYQEISQVARKRRDTKIAEFYPKFDVDQKSLPNNLTAWSLKSGYYTTEELEIIQSEATDILQKIRDQIWTSLEVTQAFCKASALAQQMTNCLTEVLYTEALERAKFLDEHLSRTGQVIGPLHGLPISLKDCFATVPHPSSVGLAAMANSPTTKNSLLVDLLYRAGAVFYVKTNIPTAMMMAHSVNNIWGETNSPVHKQLTSGGSSGGESALIAFKASPLGIGTDIGGSVRIPAGFCHLYGLKPSFGRFPVAGLVSGIPGQEFILAVNGPMSASLETVQLYCKTVLSEPIAPWKYDHKCLPIPWRQNVIQPPGRKLRLGFVGPNDGLVTCHPPVERALNTVRSMLEAAGHDIVPWPVDLHPVIVKTTLAAFLDLGGIAIMNKLNQTGEPIFPAMRAYAAAAQGGETDLGPTKLREMVMKRNQLQQAYIDLWNSSATEDKPPIDGIIMAMSPWAAPRLNQGKTDIYFGYTGVWNMLDFAACTFPVTFADKSQDKARDMKSFQQLSDADGIVQADYDADFYHGAPVSLQLVGRRLEEEKVLEMVEVVSTTLASSR